MANIIWHGIVRTILCLLLFVTRVGSLKNIQDKEKIRPFECGFDPMGDARLSFCMKFFLVCVLFLIFDVEVRLVIPLPFRSLYLLIFIIVLAAGLTYE